MFCPVVGIVQTIWPPIDSELSLAFMISQPIESYVHCLGSFWFDFPMDD